MTIRTNRIESFPESSPPHCDPLWKMELFFRLWIPGYFFLLLGLANLALTEWTTAYSMAGEQEIAKDNRLITLPQLTKEWKVSFEVKPTDYKYTGYASLLHLSIGGNRGQVGDRSPAIWLHKTRGVLVSSAIDGKVAYSKTVKPLPAAGEWTKIEVSQVLVGAKHVFSITIGDKRVFGKTNSKPVELDNVEVYSGSPWSTSQKGSLKNLKIDIKTPIDCVIAGLHIMFLIMYNHC